MNCDACGKPKYPNKDLLKCGRCKQAFYHDRDCQVKHWPAHKSRCRQLTQQQQQQQKAKDEIQRIKVEDSEDKGRVVNATQDLSPGDILLLERAAILFDTRLEYWGLLEAFGNASGKTQQQVLDLHAPDLDQIDSLARQQRHVRLEQQRQAYLQKHPHQASSLTTAITQKLLAIIETNAHQLFNAHLLLPGSNASTSPTLHNNSIDPKQYMGLFCMGSMLEHSCNPSLTMNTTRDGRLELIAETNIQSGDRVSFSYIEGVYEKSRSQRQAQLLAEKHFECQCDRCHSIDECRPILGVECTLCCKKHPLFWHEGQKGYVCVMMSPNNDNGQNNKLEIGVAESILTNDLNLANQIQALEVKLEEGSTPIQDILVQLMTIMSGTEWKECIHPLHWLNVSAHQFLSTTASAMARMENPTPTPSLLRLSVLALLHNILWVERTVCILRQGSNMTTNLRNSIVSLENDADAAKSSSSSNSTPTTILALILEKCFTSSKKDSIQVSESDVQHVLESIAGEQQPKLEMTTADVLLTVFYAGQDLILAGHSELCWLLYKRYHAWFHKLKQPSDDNRSRIDVFLESHGRTNPFADLLL